MTKEQIVEIFTYSSPTEDQVARIQRVREKAIALVEAMVENAPSSADRTAAIRKIREGVMTVNAAIVKRGKL